MRARIRTDYHTFTHPPDDIRRHLGQMGLDLCTLEADGTFRIWDSYAIQTGLVDPGGGAGGLQKMDDSMKMKDWDAGSISAIKGDVPEADKKRLHIDDNTSILVQFNDERSVSEHFRTLTLPFARRMELAAIHSVATGLYSDGFYKQWESFCDGVIDFRAKEEEDRIGHYMRMRFARGATHDSSWKRLELVGDGEVEVVQVEQAVMGERKVKDAVSESVSFLSNHDELDLSKYSVVGSYLRFDEGTRNILKDMRQKILSSFDSESRTHENYLIWASPGSGKTSLVRWIASSVVGRDVRFFEVNLSETREQDFRSRLGELRDTEVPTICLIDEVDSRQGESWPFETLLATLDTEHRKAKPVFVLAGSLGRNLKEMKDGMEARHKGTDVLSRIPAGNEYSIPAMTELDNVLVFLSSLYEGASRSGKQIDEVEKFGLYYVASSPQLTNARGIREFATRCVDRIPRGERRLKYDNMFDAGDPANKEFWASQGQLVPSLMGSFLRIKKQDVTEEIEGERRLAAIMFTDTVGFTAAAQKDEELALRLQAEQRALVRPIFAKYRGREVKTIGDAFLVEFPSALEAVKCSVDVQSALREANLTRPEGSKMLVRVGIHLGDVIHIGQDVAGDAVNVASRLEPLALPGGVCVSGQVYESVANKVPYRFESLGRPRLKNVSTQIEVYALADYGQKQVVTSRESDSPKNRIAVLPFTNISQSRADDYFADGLTEELISSISRAEGLRVIARTSVMKYRGTSKTISEIGKELNVGNVLEGSVRKSGEKVRITVQLVDAGKDEPKWSQEYDRDIRDIFSIQSDIAKQVAEALRMQVLGQVAGSNATINPEAYVDYLRGRQAWSRRNQEGLSQSIDFFQRALKSDGKYAKAYTGLADSFATLALLELSAPNTVYPKAKEAVSMALSLDPGLAEAHTSLGLIRFQYDWDWAGAEEEFREAIRINPSYAPAHHFFADLLKALGRFDEALSEIAKARELDPLNLAINTGVGHVLYLSGQYDRAIDQYRKAVDLDPTFMATHLWFGRPYLEKGMFAEAISELETAVKLSGESTLALAMLGHGLASAGRKEEAFKILEKLNERSKSQYVPSYWIAVIYNGFRNREQVVTWLEKAYEERSSWLVWSNVEPRFTWLKGDPRFDSLMSKMKFPSHSNR